MESLDLFQLETIQNGDPQHPIGLARWVEKRITAKHEVWNTRATVVKPHAAKRTGGGEAAPSAKDSFDQMMQDGFNAEAYQKAHAKGKQRIEHCSAKGKHMLKECIEEDDSSDSEHEIKRDEAGDDTGKVVAGLKKKKGRLQKAVAKVLRRRKVATGKKHYHVYPVQLLAVAPLCHRNHQVPAKTRSHGLLKTMTFLFLPWSLQARRGSIHRSLMCPFPNAILQVRDGNVAHLGGETVSRSPRS